MPNDIPIPPPGSHVPPVDFLPNRQDDREILIDLLRKARQGREDGAMIEALALNWGVPTTITKAEYDAALESARGLLKL